MIKRALIGALAVLSWLLALPVSAQQVEAPPTGIELAARVYPPSASLRIDRDIVYATYGNRQLRLDLYRPAQVSEVPIPGIVVVRGGGWMQGDKEGFGFIAGRLAEAGFAAVSIEYRTAAEAHYPAAVEDSKAAVRWLRASAARYGIDPAAIGAIGGSAGGHLVSLLALSDNPAHEGTGGNAETSSAIQAVAALAPVVDLTAWDTGPGISAFEAFLGGSGAAFASVRREASPITYARADAPPLLLIHSRIDPVVPFQQSLQMQQQYTAMGRPVELVEIDDAGHAFWNEAPRFPGLMDRVIRFFRETLISNH
jgi:acetyl esterase/lipase